MNITELKYIRVDILGLTQHEMASILGVVYRTYQAWEGGETDITVSVELAIRSIVDIIIGNQIEALQMHLTRNTEACRMLTSSAIEEIKMKKGK